MDSTQRVAGSRSIVKRNLAALVSGALLACSLVSIVGCKAIQNAAYKSAIEKALQEDALTGTSPTMEHTANMRRIDLSQCPPEFRVAYMKHIEAWEEAAKVQQAKTELDSQEDAAAAAAVLATIFSSDATPWADHERAEQEVQRRGQQAISDIHSTFETVEQIASKYGAQVPQQ